MDEESGKDGAFNLRLPGSPTLNHVYPSNQRNTVIRKITHPTRIPVPDGKHIDEHVGRVHTGTATVSVAHMVAPPGWGEPFQRPDFDEVTIVARGTVRVEHDGGTLDVSAGETILVEAGERIRYSNPFDAEAEYWAVCAPAFSPETAHREA